jgi:hypothetical protein
MKSVIAGLSPSSTDGASAFSYPIIFLPCTTLMLPRDQPVG